MKKQAFSLRFGAFLLFLTFLMAILFGVAEKTRPKSEVDVVNKSPSAPSVTVILDAGHGGEDGGAVSAGGPG